jgi:nitroimidazol reductase NimA-like FMN-containing flavoprotein (pyridoxamine 5'-phosphate oxidase superfamily)
VQGTSMIGVLATDEIDQILRRQTIGRIACSSNDHPYIVPITYAYDGQSVYAFSGPGRKIEIMREQPRVCFEVDEVDGPGEWRSVVAEGTYEELTSEKARREALFLLGIDNGPARRALAPNSRGVIFRIRLDTRSGRFEQHDEP